MDIELPDMDEMMEIIDNIFNSNIEKGKLEILINTKESEISRVAQIDQKYFVNGKPPSQSYVDSAFKFTGFDGELLEPRARLAEVTALLARYKAELELRKQIIDIWRTQAANERTVAS